METQASHGGVRLSAQKGRLVADLIRGKPVDKALNILAFSPKGRGHHQESAGVGHRQRRAQRRRRYRRAEGYDHLRRKGMVLKRFTARAKGRGNRITKPTCHIFRRSVTEVRTWDRKFIRQASAFPSPVTGRRAGLRTARTSQRCLTKTFGPRLPEEAPGACFGGACAHRAPGQERSRHCLLGPPGVVIGKKGEDIDQLRSDLQKIMGVPVHVSIEEIRKPETDAQLIADSIAQQLEKRIMFRRAMKRAMQNAMRLGAQGIKIMSSGRLNGAEIARTEWYREGRVPLHTLRADIDYATSEARTTYGVIGIKVWVFKGEIMGRNEQPVVAPEAPADDQSVRPAVPQSRQAMVPTSRRRRQNE